jgi:hypothetical protein
MSSNNNTLYCFPSGDRLNRSAPGFFRMLQEQQFETNMLHMARLTDSPNSVGKANLTIRNLPICSMIQV